MTYETPEVYYKLGTPERYSLLRRLELSLRAAWHVFQDQWKKIEFTPYVQCNKEESLFQMVVWKSPYHSIQSIKENEQSQQSDKSIS